MKKSFNLSIHLFLALTLAVGLLAGLVQKTSAAGLIIYVDAGASGGNNGTSWSDAYTDLQSALAAATSGDQIWVAAGTYTPTSGTDRAISFALRNSVAIYGGFTGTETLLSQRDWETNLTILSGDLNGDDLGFTNNSENSYHVVTGSGMNNTAVLDGFTITAGNANGASLASYGGGMYSSNGHPTLTNVTFSGNSASLGGGGMFNETGSDPILTNVVFSGNSVTSGDGGGMYNLSSSDPVLTNVIFSGNSASNHGGGMQNYNNSRPALTNVIFSGNSATNHGGGMNNRSGSHPTLTNTSFSGNSAQFGGGMYNFQSNPLLANVILWGNTASSSGPQIYNSTDFGTSATPVIRYSLVQGSGGSGAGWDSSLGTDGGGNLGADPLFMNAATGDLSLQALSPAIDAGDNTAVPGSVTTDLAGNPRFKDILSVADTGNGTPPIVDMGAYEAQFFCPAGSRFYVGADATGAESGDSWTHAFTTLQDALSITSGMCAGISEIWVAEGTYTPGASRSDTFQLLNGVAIYGGFAGTESLLSERDPAANLTILRGDLNGDDVGFTNNGENSYHVVTGSGTNSTAVLDGFTITAGNANGSSPDDQGGGMYNNAGAPTLTNVTFSANSASIGGGIYNDNSNPTLTNATFDDNQAGTGGGLFNNNSSPILTNVTLSGNSASNIGGGIYNYSGSNPILTNVTVSGNTAVNLAGGIHNEGSSPVLYNTILWGNGTELTNDFSAPTITHSIVAGGCPSGSNCTNVIDADPLLGPLQDNGGFTQTMALGAGSPAIDAGDDANCPVADQRGVTRPQGSGCDIGAYEVEIPNSAPTDIGLSSSAVNENQPAGTTVGVLSTIDPDAWNHHSYTFCGGTDDASFSIAVNLLKTAAVFDYETKSSYSICIRSTDSGSLSTTKTFVIGVNDLIDTQTFGDVSDTYWAWNFIEQLYGAGITGGCSLSPLQYCPETTVTRAQMAVFLERGIHGSTYNPPLVGGSSGFDDVPTSYWAAAWIKQLAAEGITGGCGSGLYCPESPVTRGQMAVFLLRSKYGASYAPPAVGASTGFGDVPATYWAGAWIKQLVAEGITAGCGTGTYCPEDSVTRAQMAVFLVRTFNVP
ncbi:MAG TPA: choice-of-anchor Q domain-containing protein [Anaerolineales bacterium]|nr:choice-of-anchor Q domain-containing protein [Anaerolineales bacterium]